MNNLRNKTSLKWVIMALLVLTWGSSFILMKRGLESYTAIQLGTLRIVLSFLFLLPFALSRLKKVKRKHFIYFVLVGFIGSGFPALLFAEAQTVLDSQIAGILNSTSPLFTLIVGVSFFSFKTKWYNVAGVVIGLAGAVGLLWAGNENEFSLNFGYGMYIIVATVFYAININIVKKYLTEVDSITIAAFAFMTIGIPAIAMLLATDFTSRVASGPVALINLGYIAILAVVGTALALMIYNYLIKVSSILFAASVTYLIPIVAVIWGFLDGEPFKITYIVWILLIFAGVFLVNRKSSV